METQCECGGANFEEPGYGLSICLLCGLAKPGPITSLFSMPFFRADRVLPKQCYTRLKRFKKYLFRAMRLQSANTVPEETWRYLLSRAPYRDAKHVQCTLKQARHLKRKCYDSLPFLTAQLCPHVHVPVMSEREKNRALRLFSRIDAAIPSGPFVSYLYCLEYVLKRMGRSDVCVNINRIQCPKRRARYKERLDKIFGAETSHHPRLHDFFKKQSRTPS